MNNVGELIRNLRKRRGLNLTQLGEMVGLDNSSLSRIENGKQGLTDEHLVGIAKALAVEPEFLTVTSAGRAETLTAKFDRAVHEVIRQNDPRVVSIHEQLRPLMPQELQKGVGCTAELLGYRYIATYMSRNVLMLASQAPRMLRDLPFLDINHLYPRLLYRCMLFKSLSNDIPISSRHYLAAVMVSPETDRPFPQRPVKEAAAMGLHLEPFTSFQALAERIIALEKTPTEVDEMEAGMPYEDYFIDDA